MAAGFLGVYGSAQRERMIGRCFMIVRAARSLEPDPQRFPVDACDDLQGQQRIQTDEAIANPVSPSARAGRTGRRR